VKVKDLAEFTGKDERTIQRWVKKASDKMSSINDKMSASTSTYPADYNIDEVEIILRSGSMSKDAVTILMNNARQESHTVPTPRGNTLTQRDLSIISGIVSQVFENLNMRMGTIEKRIEKRAELLPPPEISPRKQISKLVSEYCGRTKYDYRSAYQELYRDFNYRYNVNVNLKAKNRGIKVIDQIENDGMLPELVSVAAEIFARDML
jgi:hypothetical protein